MTAARKQTLGPHLEPIPSVEAAQEAARQIREAIIRGEYRSGDRLTERELTEALNISRHPVREALRLLAREGFVELHRNRGAQVSSVDASTISEVYSIRMALGHLVLGHLLGPEGSIAAVDLRRLKSLTESAARHAARKEHDATVEADLHFQQAIVDASGMARVQKYFMELSEDVRRFDRLLGIVYTEQEKYVAQYIRSLYQAIQDKDLVQADAIWQAKFGKAVERFIAALVGKDLEGIQQKRKVTRS